MLKRFYINTIKIILYQYAKIIILPGYDAFSTYYLYVSSLPWYS